MSCESMGVYQNPERECPGTCEQVPQLPAMEPTTAELLHRLGYWTVVTVIALASLAVLCGFAGYLWVRHKS